MTGDRVVSKTTGAADCYRVSWPAGDRVRRVGRRPKRRRSRIKRLRSIASKARRRWKRLWRRLDATGRWALLFLVALVFGLLAFRLVYDPRLPSGDICDIFDQRPAWFRSVLKVEERWGVSPAMQMAIVRHESGYRAHARPPRRKVFGRLPGPRPSSAFGFCQAINATWSSYQRDQDKPSARRDRFADAVDFIGWYGEHLRQSVGPRVDDPYHFYLGYNQGAGGYRAALARRGAAHRYAKRVAATAADYEQRLESCRERLERRVFWQWLGEIALIGGMLGLAIRVFSSRRRARRR